jgi:antitoxin component YwqK of YwqJK toxin-antitoxin module
VWIGACGPASAPNGDLPTWAGSRSIRSAPAHPAPVEAAPTNAPEAEISSADQASIELVATDPESLAAHYERSRDTNLAGDADGALALLAQLAATECAPCREYLHRATYDDAFASQWMRPEFVAVTTILDDHDTVGVQASRWYLDEHNDGCPEGTKRRGDERKKTWCANLQGAKHGPYTEWHAGDYALGSVKSSEGTYRDGKRHGYWVFFDIAGAISNSGAFIDGDKAGRWVDYYSEGTHYYGTEGVFAGGKPHGTHKTWRWSGDMYDALVEVGDYEAGGKTGQWTELHANGAKKRVSSYASGALHGAVFQWTEDGALLGELSFDAGTGTWTAWHDNGQVAERGDYEAGHRTGAWTRWDDAGIETEQLSYRAGAQHGAYERKHSNGQKAEAGSYAKGKRTGAWTTWYFNGDTESRGGYRAGERNGKWTYWTVGGEKAREGTYKAGAEHGTWTRYYDGNKDQQGTYKSGTRNGKWTTWHPNGSMASRGTYAAGVRSGAWTFWFDDGAKRATGRFKSDAPTGAWTVWPDGVTRRTVRVEGGVITAVDGKPATEPVSAFIPRS